MEITKQMEMVLYHSEQSDVTVNAIIKNELHGFSGFGTGSINCEIFV